MKKRSCALFAAVLSQIVALTHAGANVDDQTLLQTGGKLNTTQAAATYDALGLCKEDPCRCCTRGRLLQAKAYAAHAGAHGRKECAQVLRRLFCTVQCLAEPTSRFVRVDQSKGVLNIFVCPADCPFMAHLCLPEDGSFLELPPRLKGGAEEEELEAIVASGESNLNVDAAGLCQAVHLPRMVFTALEKRALRRAAMTTREWEVKLAPWNKTKSPILEDQPAEIPCMSESALTVPEGNNSSETTLPSVARLERENSPGHSFAAVSPSHAIRPHYTIPSYDSPPGGIDVAQKDVRNHKTTIG